MKNFTVHLRNQTIATTNAENTFQAMKQVCKEEQVPLSSVLKVVTRK